MREETVLDVVRCVIVKRPILRILNILRTQHLGLGEMEVLLPVMKYRTFPIIHDKMERDISSMLSFQKEEKTDIEEAVIAERITDKYIGSLAPRYDPVGVNAAQVVAENMVQSSLSSHRMAGVSKAASGFERIKEIANLSNKQDIVKVVTTPIRGVPRSRMQINEIANIITRLTMDEITTGFDIIAERPLWYPVFIKLNDVPPQLLRSRFLRIYLDEYKLYKHRIPLSVLCNTLRDTIGDTGVVFLYPPASIVENLYIDVHDGSVNESLPPLERDFPLYSRIPEIRSQIVGGIPSVTSAEPVGVNLLKDLQVVQIGDEFELRSKTPDFVHPSAWSHLIKMLVPDVEILSPSGRLFRSRDEKYRNLDTLKHIILGIPAMYESVANPPKILDDGRVLITFRRDMEKEFPYLSHVVLEDRIFDNEAQAEDFLLLNIAEFIMYWYIEAMTEKAQDLYAMEEIDSTRTYTTSPHNLIQTIGYMAMRSMIFQEFKANISVNEDLVKIIINNITLYQEPVSFTRQAMHNDKTEFLTYTTFENVLDYVTRAAFAGETDHMLSISSKILTGNMINVGRGGDRLNKENSYLKARREQRAKEKTKSHIAPKGE